jgi:hypothetical protein
MFCIIFFEIEGWYWFLCFRKHTRIGKPTSLHVDKVIKNIQAPPLPKSLWNDIIEQSNSIAASKECQYVLVF